MKYFTEKELACQHCGEEGIDHEFMGVIEELREELGFPFVVTSGYRCAEHPIEKRKNSPGAHQSGRAIDIAVHGERAMKLIDAARAKGFKRIGVAQKGSLSSRFIHLDDCADKASPALWSY